MEVVGALENAQLEAAAPSRYVGEVHVHTVATPFDGGFDVRLVRLEPGARSRPHVSTSGRLIHVVGGEAVIANREERVVVGRGDTVIVAPGEWHWHGGLPHIAAELLIIERGAEVSFEVPEHDWSLGYGP
jgi:quercetin dioxygenase-like cupin family protein